MNGRDKEEVEREEEEREAVAAADTEAEGAEEETERDDALWWWTEEWDKREDWIDSDLEDGGASECVGAGEEGTLCNGGGGGSESVGGEGLRRTDWVRLCWAWDERGRGEDAEARRVEAGWGVVCCWVWEEVEEEEERLSRELRPPEVGSVAPN